MMQLEENMTVISAEALLSPHDPTGRKLQLPPISYPIRSPTMHPLAEIAGQAAFEWGLAHGIYSEFKQETYRQIRVGPLVGLISPNGTPEGLKMSANWVLWLFAFDDHYCDESAIGCSPEKTVSIITRLLGILEGSPHGVHSGPFEASFADFMRQFLDLATPVQLARFQSSVGGYFLSMGWEALNRARSSVPQIPAYLHMRYHSGAVPTCVSQLDIIDAYELSSVDYCDPDVEMLKRSAVNIICWSNDVLSYYKETKLSRVVHSLPTILQHHYGIGPQQSLERTVAMHDTEVKSYIKVRDMVVERSNENLRYFIGGLDNWIVANFEWSILSGRY
ncbi:hypothetical protein [Afipia sp. GAS231]|uniref:terpene synthase family protein n=1 Tax=Afipia sp. GAS231 TaxID=1882747 RepID=UPI000B8A3F8F|nr:hypothetical protein [Afipia sp. GAS231]